MPINPNTNQPREYDQPGDPIDRDPSEVIADLAQDLAPYHAMAQAAEREWRS